ncbi:major facilitator superfamily transporter, possible sugar permease [Campylobacter pinnipediorum subsp. caledonicus]|uniref:Major facilitator superfamily transporter, possible sugar permease n=1 Tax=Campylobacter pinnipediorum subsp. caledonicus TaxID=1874362 RepID=A0A1S6U8Q8_9BACT|nr:MFS transporter [Campylobacter pinnipediorum]AQW86476.1 major facilitator superfamily transporter, possible sugar permease [Campylobacter pinnipediorum subsp. caledonicus]AQW88128.1 major facilitator superfamily transporter, possible sugar permease [Campylobacter pinnipediorum subsp. caledonicus]OPA71569.1 MFS transporter [Campylobacter pinnipediorum subsp. caledonicus]OPA79736.1 MFS transporter [Campylobacter pinnipediorum subsp. pinnipediorum]
MSNSKRIIKTMMPLFLGMSLLFVGNGLVVSSLSTLLKQMNIDNVTIGLINACFFVGAILSTLTSHIIISKVGHIRSFAIFSAFFGVCSMVYELGANLYFWAFLRGCLGYCYYALLVVIESWLNEKARNKNRSRILAFYEGVFYVSFGVGILILALNLKPTQIFIISAAFIMLSSIPLNLTKIRQPAIPQRQNASFPKIFSVAPLALVGSVVAGVLINGFFSMASLFILSQGFSLTNVSFFMTIAMLGGFVSQFIMGYLSDTLGRKFAIISSSLVGFFASIGFLFVGNNIILQYVLSFFLGGGIFCLYVLSLARANDMLEHKSKSMEIGRTLLFSYSFGSLVSSIVIGFAMNFFGNFGFIYVYIVLLFVLIVFALTKESIPKEDRISYNPHTIKTTVIDELNIEYENQESKQI